MVIAMDAATCPHCSKRRSGMYDLTRLCCAVRMIERAAPVHREAIIGHVIDSAPDEIAQQIRDRFDPQSSLF
ncbi:molybdenum import ATP-binding protein ModC [Burkholderiales bacterium GJ-E10]|nr:molybdenum import ATP-binding protein ModC [Burkholderiales bacterium GJ-E10]